MSFHGLVLLCLVYALAVATPGPGIAAIVARVLGRGARGLPAFIGGFVVGDLLWFTLAATGMAALAQRAQLLFTIVKYAGAVYLLYLALRLWRAPARPVESIEMDRAETSFRSFLASLTLTLGNPKAMVFFLALLPAVVDLRQMTARTYAEVALMIVVLLSTILFTYALTALRARRLFKNARAVRWLNRASGTVMAGAALGIAAE
ncbi:MAG TPA: LysE family translocator [Steroidobacteraceae bacterium]|nr:LysE family translocator [Steroidobacteraceae bacterium]